MNALVGTKANQGILSFFKRTNKNVASSSSTSETHTENATAEGHNIEQMGAHLKDVQEVETQVEDVVIVQADLCEEASTFSIPYSQPSCHAKENVETKKRKRKSSEWTKGREFQPDWAGRFPFIQPVFENEETGVPKSATRMRCAACSWKNKNECLLQLKLDTIEKHVGKVYEKKVVEGKEVSNVRWKSKEECRHLQAVEEYKVHLEKQDLPVVLPIKSMLQKMTDKMLKCKIVQLQALFHVLKRGKPLHDYPALEHLLVLQPISDFPSTHWSIQSGEEFAKCIDQVLVTDLREEVHNCDYFAISLDEASAKDMSSWCCMSVYLVKNFVRQAFYIGITCLQKNATAENIFGIVEDSLKTQLGLSPFDIAKKLVCIGLDGCSVMQGCRNGLTIRIQTSLAPYALGIHCMAHRMNLAYKIIDTFESVTKIENLVCESYNFFCRSSKRTRKLKKYAAGLTKGSKLLKNVNTRWISLYKPAARLFQEYPALVGLMDKLSTGKEKDGKEKAQELLNRLTDLETLLNLAGLLPMLREMNMLILFAQERTMYIPEYVTARKLACVALDCLYPSDPDVAYHKDKFMAWHNLVHIEGEKSASMLQYDSKGHLCMKVHSRLVQMFVRKSRIRGRLLRQTPVTRDSFAGIISAVKSNLAKVASTLAAEIRERFPRDELLEAMAIVYPQFWVGRDEIEKVQADFKSKLAVLRDHFAKRINVESETMHGTINGDALLMESQCFGQTMWSQCRQLEKPKEFGSITRLWVWLSNSQVLRDHMPEYFKLAALCQTMILGSVEDERIFSIMGYLKNKVRNRLHKNLDLCLRAYACNYTVANFPYDRALALWASTSRREHGEAKNATDLTPNESSGWLATDLTQNGSSAWSALS